MGLVSILVLKVGLVPSDIPHCIVHKFELAVLDTCKQVEKSQNIY